MPAPHHGDNGFRNLRVSSRHKGLLAFLRLRYFGGGWPDYQATAHRVPRVTPSLDAIRAPGEAPQVTWIGHSTVLVQYRGVNLLTDPVFAERVSPLSWLGPKRVTPPGLRVEELPRIDVVLLSHNHYDHLDERAARALGGLTTWLTPLGYREILARFGVERVVEFDWWTRRELADATVTATPSQHWTGRGLRDRYRVLWASWAVEIGGFRFWFAGDTGYDEEVFKDIGRRCGPFDLALIPVGGYAPRWFMKDMHVDPEEAVAIHRDVRSRYSVGIHWGTFPLTAEPIDEPPRRLREAAQFLQGSAFVTCAVGETVTIPLRPER